MGQPADFRILLRDVLVAINIVTFAAALAFAQPGGCNQPAEKPDLTFRVPGMPFEALASPDGCWIFVSLIPREFRLRGDAGEAGGIAVLQRADGQLKLKRIVSVDSRANSITGIVLSHDGKLLIATAHGPASPAQRPLSAVVFLDVSRLESGKGNPVLGVIHEEDGAGAVYVNVTSDDRLAFVSDESLRRVSVIDLEKARRTGFTPEAVIGAIPVGAAPVGLAFSNDGRYLFVTSQVWDHGTPDWPVTCVPEGPARRVSPDENRRRPEGALSVVSVAEAVKDPARAVRANVPAGCSPVRVVLAPDGATVYVTARNSNAVLAFATKDLISDHPERALIARVPVGTSPVGVEVVDGGRTVVVTDSSRFGGSGGSNLTVIDASQIRDAKSAVKGTIPAGEFPRELHATADGNTLLLTNFASQEIELIDVARIPSLLKPASTP